MASFSDYLETHVLDHITGKTSYTKPTAYVALFTSTPSDSGSGTEVSGGSYARVATAGADWNAASAGAVDNANDFDFGTASADWGTIVAAALMDASSTGNVLVWGGLAANKTVSNGDSFVIAAGDFSISLD